MYKYKAIALMCSFLCFLGASSICVQASSVVSSTAQSSASAIPAESSKSELPLEEDTFSSTNNSSPHSLDATSNRFTSYYPPSESNPVYAIDENFTFVSENEHLALYVKNGSLAIRILNKHTGYIWSSNVAPNEEDNLNERWQNYFESGVSVEYYNPKTTSVELKTSEETLLTSKKTKANWKTIPNGFSATISLGESGIGFTYNVTLHDNGLDIKLDDAQIYEGDSKKLVSITLYPLLGHTKSKQQQGYYFIPDGDGALVNFKTLYTNLNSGYSKPYYGNDIGYSNSNNESNFLRQEHNLQYPVYGVVHGVQHNGFSMEILSGASHAELFMNPAGVRTNYYYIGNKFVFRFPYAYQVSDTRTATILSTERVSYSIHERFTLLEGSEATYSGIAKEYRTSLAQQNALPKNTVSNTSIPLYLDALAAGAKEGVFKNKNIEMTTIQDLETIYNTITAAKIGPINIRYSYSTQDIFTQNVHDRLTLRSGLGSKNQLTEFQNNLKQNNGSLAFVLNYAYINGKSNGVSLTENVIRSANKAYLISPYKFGAVSANQYSLNASGFETLFSSEVENFSSFGIENVFLHMPLLASSFNGTSLNREQAMETIANTFKNTVPFGGTLTVTRDALLPAYSQYINTIANIDMAADLYPYITDTVPFTSLVYKGAANLSSSPVNYFGTPEEELLRMVEWGIYPTFDITAQPTSKLMYSDLSGVVSSEFKQWEPSILNTYTLLNTPLQQVEGATIENHEVLASGVVKISYSNNKSIIVNYNNAPYEYNNVIIQGKNSGVISA